MEVPLAPHAAHAHAAHRIPRRAFSRIYDLRPRLAVLAALLDDWASRPLHHYLPKWNIDDEDDDAIFPRRPPFELRRSYSARKPDDGLYWMFDDELLMAGCGAGAGARGGPGPRRPHAHSSRRPRSVDELRYLRRQYFEGRDDQDDGGEVQFNSANTKNERQVPVQIQSSSSSIIHRCWEEGQSEKASIDRPLLETSPVRSPMTRAERPSPSSAARPRPRAGSCSPLRRPQPQPQPQPEPEPARGDEPVRAASSRWGHPHQHKSNAFATDSLPKKDASTLTDGTMVPLSMLDSERTATREMREENARLEAVISNLQEVNRRWQAINADRQAYIQRLLATIEDQQRQLNACLDALRTPLKSRPAAPPEPEAELEAEPRDREDAELQRLRSLQREVAGLQRRLEEAKKEHREAVALQGQYPTCLRLQVENRNTDDWQTENRREEAAASLRKPSEKIISDDNPSDSKIWEEADNEISRITQSCRSTTAANNLLQQHLTDSNMSWPAAKDDTTPAGGTEECGTEPELEAGAVRDRIASQYSFTGEALSSLCGRSGALDRRAESPSLSDALTPTPTPTPHQQPGACYPVEVSGSASSLGSCPGAAPHVSVPSSSRASTPDPDLSMCSDVTLDCSPPSPIQGTLTVGFNGNGLASVTSFRLRSGPEDRDAPGRGTLGREDVICPSCGEVFPPEQHLQFLDHFEMCANPSLYRPRR